MLLEVIVQSVADARAAHEGGADRLEVVRDIDRDGLTPSADLVRAIAADVPVPLRVMVRETDGFELTGPAELDALRRAIETFAELGVDGIVVGYVRGGRLDVETLRELLSAAPAIRATLHRAFDAVADQRTAIADARSLPQIDRILTSGGEGSAPDRCRRLREYAAIASPDITILAGGGVDEVALRALAGDGCVREAHVGRAARADGRRSGAVSADRVRRLREIVDR